MLVLVIIFLVAGIVLGGVAFLAYRKILRRAKGIERGLKMVPILIHLPPSSDAQQNSGRDAREIMREKVSQAQSLYDLIAGTTLTGFKSRFYGQRHISLELVAGGGLIHYYMAVPVALVSVVEKALLTAYPGARLEQTEDYNIFNPNAKIAGTSGGELTLKKAAAYPIATIDKLERDPMEAVINSMTQLGPGEGAAIQILLRPANPSWIKRSAQFAKRRRAKGATTSGLGFGVKDLAKAAIKAPEVPKTGAERQLTGLEQSEVESIENKTRHAGYEVLIRMVAAAENVSRSQTILRDMVSAFALFDSPGLNGFKFLPAGELEGLVTAFIFRFFPPELNSDILNSLELAGLYHLPDGQVTATRQVERQASKQIDGPPVVPTQGLLFGFNEFRGNRKEIRLAPEDRRRHTYILGQTGSGKSILLENLAVQDMLAGNGFAFIDPHGDTAEKLISMVPKSRVEDVIYFNPADTEFPLGLNLFEFSTPEQKDFLVQEAINMLYKIYDAKGQGVIGPRFEQWFRNAALTIMSDPEGATFIEVPKVFLDSEFLKAKFKYLKDPTVIDFWTKEMAQTSDYHKSEMLGWFASKFGAFQQNEIMRNIIGQTKSAFNLRDIMDQKKILIVNLSKGQIGELNSKLLGMIFVIKFQAAAMSRAGTDPSQRPDFCLYVDEFQNFSTDSFASILSEARKYGLNLIVANQFIGQLTNEIRDAVFGNVGTMISFRTGPEDAEFLVKQFAPVFDAHDLVNLEIGHAAIRLLISGLPSQPFSISTLPPLDLANRELGLAVKQLSAAKFGATRAQVEATIFSRLGSTAATPAPTPANSVGSAPQPAAPTQPASVVQPLLRPSVPAPATTSVPAESVSALSDGQQRPDQPVVSVPLPTPKPAAAVSAVLPDAAVAPAPLLNVPPLTQSAPMSVAPAAGAKPAVNPHNSLSIDDIVKDLPPRPASVSSQPAMSRPTTAVPMPIQPVVANPVPQPAPAATLPQQPVQTIPTEPVQPVTPAVAPTGSQTAASAVAATTAAPAVGHQTQNPPQVQTGTTPSSPLPGVAFRAPVPSASTAGSVTAPMPSAAVTLGQPSLSTPVTLSTAPSATSSLHAVTAGVIKADVRTDDTSPEYVLPAAKAADDNLAAEIKSAGLGSVIKLVGGNEGRADQVHSQQPKVEVDGNVGKTQAGSQLGVAGSNDEQHNVVASANEVVGSQNQPATLPTTPSPMQVSIHEINKVSEVNSKQPETQHSKPLPISEHREEAKPEKNQPHHSQHHEKSEHPSVRKDHQKDAQRDPSSSRHTHDAEKDGRRDQAEHHSHKAEPKHIQAEVDSKPKPTLPTAAASNHTPSEAKKTLSEPSEPAKNMPRVQTGPIETKVVPAITKNVDQPAPLLQTPRQSEHVSAVAASSVEPASLHNRPVAQPSPTAAASSAQVTKPPFVAASQPPIVPKVSPTTVNLPPALQSDMGNVVSHPAQPIATKMSPLAPANTAPVQNQPPKVPIAPVGQPMVKPPRAVDGPVPYIQHEGQVLRPGSVVMPSEESVQAKLNPKPAVDAEKSESLPSSTSTNPVTPPNPQELKPEPTPLLPAEPIVIKPEAPQIAPGEIYVDSDGNVHTAEDSKS